MVQRASSFKRSIRLTNLYKTDTNKQKGKAHITNISSETGAITIGAANIKDVKVMP